MGAFCLLLCSPAGVAFWVIYGLCGISDMVDGYLARRLHAESKAGAVLDSVADLCFVACCAIKLMPVLQIPSWLWIWAGVIVLIKLVNQVSALAAYKHLCFPHTLANKLTGLLLFPSVPMTCWSFVPIAIVAGVATFAAIQEGHFIRTRKIEYRYSFITLRERPVQAVEDLRAKGISPVYLLTDHTGFYERYGWEFLCMAQGDGESYLSRMYVHY
jgi:CDP-diacylglycerol--glycerol-3-phosphate 3-phosphatidyltransferase